MREKNTPKPMEKAEDFSPQTCGSLGGWSELLAVSGDAFFQASKYLLRRYLDPPNPPSHTFSEYTTGALL